MEPIFEELKNRLCLEYLSDIRFRNRAELMKHIKEISEEGKYSEEEIKKMIEYINE